MALVRFNPAIVALQGKVGGWVHRHWYGKPVVQKVPKRSKRILSPAQVAHIARFTVAAKAAPAMLAPHKAVCRRLARTEKASEISMATRACFFHQPSEEMPGKPPPTP